jgi:NodT family efflux transporter outer membrane factor (OMF) lipoprotein
VKKLTLLAVLLAVSACTTVGPDYHPPAPEAGAFLGGDPKLTATTPPPASWWRLYDDGELNRLEEEARVANLDLRAAAANLARAQALQQEVDSAQDVGLAADFAVERTQLSGESYLVPAQLPSQYLGDGGLHLAYQLDLFGRLKRASEAAAADRETVAAANDVAAISIAAEVARAYGEACAAGHQRDTAQRLLDLQERVRAVTVQLAKAGRDSPLEVTRVAAGVDQARAALPLYEARQKLALYRLAVLTGHPPAEFPRPVADCRQPPRLYRPIPIGDGASLLRRRPDVRQAERALAAATARVGVAMAALYPDITLGLGAGSTGRLTDLGMPAAEYWSVGSLISWRLPDAAAHARISGADAAAKAALAHFDGVVLTALRETESSLTVYQQDLERNAALRAARDHAAELTDQTDRLRQAGRSPYLSGLSAQQGLAQAEQSLALSDDQISADQITLFLALGGGWD